MKMQHQNSIDRELYRSLGGPVSDEFVGMRIDGYLSRFFPFFSRAMWQTRLKQGHLLVNSLPVRVAYRLRQGDRISMYHPPEVEPEVDLGVYQIWESQGVMAVYKPANLPMHENGPYRKNTFAHQVRLKLGDDVAAVHRLDRETSGIVICANQHNLREQLARLFMSRTIEKTYLAIVEGVVERESWIETGPIGDLASSAIRIKKWVVADGQSAQTRFRVLARGQNHSLVAAQPKTGRTNQIRIHLAVAGHRIVGDKLYHPNEDVFLSYYEKKNLEWVNAQAGFSRLCLHAAALSFAHPTSGKNSEICCPMPKELRGLWAKLR